MTSAKFTGTTQLAYPQFLDDNNGDTVLVAQPQITYDTVNAAQWNLTMGPVPGDGNWQYVPSPVYSAGFNARPGVCQPGLAYPGWPGTASTLGSDGGPLLMMSGAPVTISVPVTAAFIGTSPREYPQFLDLGNAGVTLVAQPQTVYTVETADQWDIVLQSPPGDGLWALTQTKPSGFGAIPGLAYSGLTTPSWSGTGETDIIPPPVPGGEVLGPADIALVTVATFIGASPREYPQWLDAGDGSVTLVAQPQTAYLVTNADQWTAALGLFPGDGLWALGTPGQPASFTSNPGSAIAGLSSPGYPGGGGTGGEDAAVFGSAFDAATLDDAPLLPPADPGPRIITGRPRKLPPPPPRRRHPRRQRTPVPSGR